METADLLVNPRQLIQHERVQQQRLRAVAAQVAREGIRVPVAVTPVGDDRYFVLDGAHRSTAASLVGLERVPCTLVEITGTPAIDGWTHVVRGLRMAAAHDLSALADVRGGPSVATIRLFGRRWQLCATDDSPEAVHRAFHRVGALYGHRPYDRVPRPVAGAWCQVTWQIPGWSDLLGLVTRCGPLPAGVTRFAVDRRAEQLPAAA